MQAEKTDEMTAETPDDAFYSAVEEPADKGDSEGASDADSVDEEAEKSPTALIPLSAIGKRAKVGDSITVKVMKIEGEDAVVELSSTPAKVTPPSASQELDDMAAEKG